MNDRTPPHRPLPVPTADGWPIDETLTVPVRFLPPALQPVALRFGALVRAARDLARDETLAAGQRMALIDAVAGGLAGQRPEMAPDATLSRLVDEFAGLALSCDADTHHAIHVLQACRQDIDKSRYRDWNELLLYCRYAAAPLGRFCLEAMGEDEAAQAPAEALCCALAILLILRDCGRDYRRRGLVYLPERWFTEAGTSAAALDADRTDDKLRRVFAQALDAADRLAATADPLPRLIRDRHLRAASAAALTVARRLARRLREGDPLARTITLTRGDRRAALWSGRWRKLWR